jgi:MoaA/NifB/PqqE/SkfB family radical SAM enzyme
MKTFPDFPLFVASSFRSVISNRRLVNCIWELTYRCNAKCGFCSCWQYPNELNEELQFPEVKKGLDNIYKSGCRLINFSGGEPTLRDDLEDIVSYASEKKFWTSLVTNGSLTDNTRINELKHAGLDNLVISLDFIDKESHDNNRNIIGLYDNIINAIEYLGSHFVGGHRIAGIMCVISETNMNSIEPLARLAEDNGVFISYQLYHSQKFANNSYKINDVKMVTSILLELKRKYWNVISSKSYLSGMNNYKNNRRPCYAGRKYFSIDPLGYLHPCVDMPRVGHVLENPISIVNSEIARQYVSNCDGCWYCFRGEADHALSIRGSAEKIAQFGNIILKVRK